MAQAEMAWYVLRAISGKEGKVKEYIDAEIKNGRLGGHVAQVLIPTEKVKQIRGNKQVVKERLYLPGYVLVNMVVNDDTWVLLRNIRGVTGFVGPEGKPIPLTDEEIRNLNLVQSVEEAPFSAGDNVKVVSGPMANFTGIVESVDMKERKARVIISMGGRDIPAEIGIGDLAAL